MSTVQYRPTITTSRNDVNFLTEPGRTLQTIIDDLAVPMNLVESLRVSINGSYVPPSTFKFITPKAGTDIKILLVPQGGDFLQIAGLIALAVAAAYTGGAAAGAYGAFAGAAVSVGITVAGTLALNAIFPPPNAPEMNDQGEASAALTVTGQVNSARYDKGVQRIYGTVKNYPPIGAQPYTVSSANDQYLYMLFDMGYGEVDVSELKLGNTNITDFQEVEVKVHNAVKDSNDLDWFTSDVDTSAVNVEMSDGDPTTTRTSSTEQKFAQFDLLFNSGLVGFSSTLKEVEESVTFTFVIKDENGVVLLPSEYAVHPLDTGQRYWNSVSSSVIAGTINVVGKEKDGFGISYELRTVAPTSKVTIELTRTTSTDNGVTTINRCAWTSLRTFRDSPAIKQFRLIDTGVYATHTMIEMRIRATDQLSGLIDDFNCVASGKVRTWDGATFTSNVVSDNPAWVYADILTGTMNQHPKDDTAVNWSELLRWADFCDELVTGQDNTLSKSHTCNFVLDYSATMFSLMSEVAAVGRASPDVYNDQYSIIFEEEKSQKVQMFTNMNSSGFQSNRSYSQLPDAVKVSFKDPASDWVMRDLIVYNDGFDETNAKIFETIQSPKTLSSDEAYREGRYWLKAASVRQEEISFVTDIDWLECRRGSLIGFQQDVMQVGGTVARVKEVDGTVLTLDTDANMNGNQVGAFELRPQVGTIISGPIAVFQLAAPRVIDIGVAGASVGDLIVINEFGKSSYELIVKAIDVNADYTATINCVEYAPAIFDLASDPVPTYNPNTVTVYAPNNVPTVMETLVASEILTLVTGTYYASIKLDYTPGLGPVPVRYKIYKQATDFSWELVGTTTNLSYTWGSTILITSESIVGVSHSFAVVGVSANDEHLTPQTAKQVTIVPQGSTTKPAAPDYFNVENTAENTRRFWWGYDVTSVPNDLAGFKIKYTRSLEQDWGSATSLHDGLLIDPPFEIRALPQGAQNVMMRSVDVAGNEATVSRVITFDIGDRPVANVLFQEDMSLPRTPASALWGGFAVKGNPVILSTNLSADTSTSGVMWSSTATDLMWNDADALMWNTPNDSFVWGKNITVPAAGITTIAQTGNGELKLKYSSGTYPDSFRQVENAIPAPGAEDFLKLADGGTVWTTKGTLTSILQTSSSLRIGPDGSLDKVWRMTGAANGAALRNDVPFPLTGMGTWTYFSISVRKGTLGRLDGSYPGLWMQSGARGVLFMIDKLTGETGVENVGSASLPAVVHGSTDQGDFWRFTCGWEYTQSDTYEIWPAAGANSDFVYDVNASGASDFFGAMVQRGNTPIEYTPLSSLIYSGTGQGVIPYTSPVFLDAGDYTLLVDSVKAVDVNRLDTLDWTTDVDDINETLISISVAATGDTIVPLTKPFVAVTNVGATVQNYLQTPEIVSTTPTDITVRIYDVASGNQVAGLLDLRIQGY